MKTHSEYSLDNAGAKIWHGDALDGLRDLGEASVDLVVTSPPYFIGKEYDRSVRSADFAREIRRILPEIDRVLKPSGSVCWQVGNHVHNGRVTPLDFIVAAEMAVGCDFVLRNRIIWTFGHGRHANRRLSGRHETILWYSKGEDYTFDLDAIRVPQIYPGKRHYKGPNKGDWSGHPLGKNPGDAWDIGELWNIPNVNANHVEKTEHPCQFPTALARRLIATLTPANGVVVDPYLGSGSSAVAALLEGRNFIGGDIEQRYLTICAERLIALKAGSLRIRDDVPVLRPKGNLSVAALPEHFRTVREVAGG